MTSLDTPLDRRLTVEIHDVSPAYATEVHEMGAALAEVGVRRPVLLVVPSLIDSRGSHWDLRADDRLVDWLGDQQRAGAEIVLHGLTHRAPHAPPPGVGNYLMHRFFARGLAEFAHLSRMEALIRLDAGLRILKDCGLKTAGFIAPAWQQSAEAIVALRELGFRFTTFFNRVLPLVGSARPVTTVALTFDAANPAIDYAKRVLMRGVERAYRQAQLLRVALHPRDLHGRRPLEHILARVRALLPWRPVTTYGAWLDAAAA